MKNKLPLLLGFLALQFLAFSQAPLTRVWEKSQSKPLGDSVPTWFGVDLTRGIGYGNNHLYVVSRLGGNHINVVDPTTGLVMKELSVTGISGGTFQVNDVEVSEDGQIFVCNLTTNAQTSAFKIYRYKTEAAQPEVFVNFLSPAPDAPRLGDKFTVVGNATTGTASIYAVPNNSTSTANKWVYRWDITDGVLNTVPVKIPIAALSEAFTAFGSFPSVAPLGPGASEFWLNGNTMVPCKYSSDGTFLEAIPSTKIESSSSSIQYFTYNSKNYLAAFTYKTGNGVNNYARMVILDVAQKDTFQMFPNLGINNNGNGCGELEIVKGPENSLAAFYLGTNNGFAGWSTAAPPYAENVMLADTPQVGQTLIGNYTYKDINGDLEGTSIFRWYSSDTESGAFTEIAGASTAQLLLPEALKGKYVKFGVSPVAATGNLLNGVEVVTQPIKIVGTDAAKPVVTGVDIPGPIKARINLTVAYSYSDANNDPEGATKFIWYYAQDATGLNSKILPGVSTATYSPVDSLISRYLRVAVIPVAQAGFFTIGDTVKSSWVGPVLANPPTAPEAKDVKISGTPNEYDTLTGSYTYYDLNDDPENGTVIRWFSQLAATSNPATDDTIAEGVYSIILHDSLVGKYIAFEVIPINKVSPEVGTQTRSTAVGPVVGYNPSAPVATNVVLTGVPEQGIVLSVSYTYTDANGEPEGATALQWKVADNAAGTGATNIPGATKNFFIPGNDLVGKYIIAEVTPVEISPVNLTGSPVKVVTPTPLAASPETGALDRIWLRTFNGQNLYSWFGSSYQRNFAVYKNKIYIANRQSRPEAAGNPIPYILNAKTGEVIGELKYTLEDGRQISALGGHTHHLSDVEVSEDGQILGCSMLTDGSSNFWRVYKWASDTARPTIYIEYKFTATNRVGDKFRVTGNVSSNAYIYAAGTGTHTVYRWKVTGGVLNTTPEVIETKGPDAFGSFPVVYPTLSGNQDEFFAEGYGSATAIFNKNGDLLDTIPVGRWTKGSSDGRLIELEGVQYLVKYNFGTMQLVVLEIPDGDFLKTIEVARSQSMGNNFGNGSYEVATSHDTLWFLGENTGVGAYKFNAAKIAPRVIASVASERDVVELTFHRAITSVEGNESKFTVVSIDTITSAQSTHTVITVASAADGMGIELTIDPEIPLGSRVFVSYADGSLVGDNLTPVANFEDYEVQLNFPTQITDPEANGFSLYPNPVNDKLSIRGTVQISRVEILNITGQLLMHYTLDPAPEAIIHVGNLKSGVYLLKVYSKEGSVSVLPMVKK